MDNEKRRDTTLTPEVLDWVTRAQQDRDRRAREKAEAEAAKAEAEAAKARKTKVWPHETGRKARQMSFTLPSAEWKTTLQDKANEWGLRPSDILVYCLAYTMAAIESGEIQPPKGDGRRSRHRAGESLDLPWKPEKKGR